MSSKWHWNEPLEYLTNTTKRRRINEKGHHNLRRRQEPRKKLGWRALQQ